MTKFIGLEDAYQMSYPVGQTFGIRFNQTIISMTNALQGIYNKNDSLVFACTGSSGAIIASAVCTKLFSMGYTDLKIYYIQKKGEMSHYPHSICWDQERQKIIIIDDFLRSGATVDKILNDLKQWYSIERCDTLITTTIYQSVEQVELSKRKACKHSHTQNANFSEENLIKESIRNSKFNHIIGLLI